MSHSNEIGNKAVQQYIGDSKPVQLIVSGIDSSNFHFITGNARLLGKAPFPASSTVVYNSTKKKYFIVQFFDANIKGVTPVSANYLIYTWHKCKG